MYLPYYYGNNIYASKIKHLKTNINQYNTVIFGSSRMYRQLDPLLLDSLLINLNIKTYSLASPATYYPESFYLYENFIDRLNNNKIKYAYMELQHLELFKNNASTIRGNYWNTYSSLVNCLKFINDSHYSEKKKYQMKTIYYSSFFNRIIDFSSMRHFFEDHDTYTRKAGFYPLEDELLNNKALQKRNDLLYTNQMVLKTVVHAANQIDSINTFKPKLNQAYLSHLTQLIKKSEEKGIHLIYILPPRLNLQYYKELIPICKALPKSNIIELATYKKNKALYDIENSFDYDHLNKKGVDIFTNKVALKTLDILQK